MAKQVIATSSAPATPAAGNVAVWPDTRSKRMASTDDTGRSYVLSGAGITNASIASQGAGFATDTWVTDSDLIVPDFGLQVRTRLQWIISVSKTAAGTAAPVFTVRLGTARTTSDAAILAITGAAQTAATDTALFQIFAVLRNVGAAGVLQGTLTALHNNTATGFATNVADVVEATSAGFDTTAAGGKYFSLSINAGASAAWTVTQVHGQMGW